MPTLVTLGTRDMITPERTARPWFEMIPGVDIVRFEGSHFPMFEAPATLTVTLLGLIERAHEQAHGVPVSGDDCDAAKGRN